MTLSANAERLLDVYRIGGGTPSNPRRSITARMLRDACQTALDNPDTTPIPQLGMAIKAIESFVERGGCKYSYEDYDVLNYACTELYRTGFRFPED